MLHCVYVHAHPLIHTPIYHAVNFVLVTCWFYRISLGSGITSQSTKRLNGLPNNIRAKATKLPKRKPKITIEIIAKVYQETNELCPGNVFS